MGERGGSEAAEAAVAHARRALAAGVRARREGNAGAAERAMSIAEAALTLADRLVAQRRTRRELEEARHREEQAHTRAQSSREALERALLERARVLSELGPEPSAPVEGQPE